MQYRPPYTISDVRRWVFQAETGSPSLYNKLDSEWATLARITNRRMKRLEHEELDFYDYDRIYTHIRNEFPTRKKRMPDHVSTATMTRESIIDNFEQMLTFINAPASTVSGATEKMERNLKKFEDFTDTIIPPHAKKKFARLVADDRISDLLEMTRKESGDVIEAIYYMAENDVDIYKREISSKLYDMLSGTGNIDDFLKDLKKAAGEEEEEEK